MNISALARQLNTSTVRLKEMLPELGFDIGAKAIKIDDRQAQRIIKGWRNLRAEYDRKKRIEADTDKKAIVEDEIKQVSLPGIISVKELAVKLNLPVSKVSFALMQNGILASLNERIDYDTAAIIAQELGFEVNKEQEHDKNENEQINEVKEKIENDQKVEGLETRAPIVVVMGHVDHGKTKLLDAIRKTNIIDKEAGGITQHIGAYQTEWINKETQAKSKITFIDTPGHAAFMAMRSRGAKVADISILIVAADDGVQPQTEEAYNIIKAAGLPFLVAINKIDKEGANPERVKQELAQLGVISEDWGGKIPFVQISAKNEENIDEILDTLLLIAEIENEKIKANPYALAVGSVIESHIDKGEGPVSTVLIQNGTLKRGDNLTVNGVFCGKVRALKDWAGHGISLAPPSTPVKILGLKISLQVGDVINAVSEKIKSSEKKIKKSHTASSQMIVAQKIQKNKKEDKALKVIIKTDVIGSLEAIIGMIEKIHHPEVSVEVIAKGLGGISEADVFQAQSAKAVIYGFNVDIAPSVFNLAKEKNVGVEQYKIIYELIDSLKGYLEGLLDPEVTKISVGKLKVLAVFRSEKNAQVIGARCEEGIVRKELKVDILRKDERAGGGKISEVRLGKGEIVEAQSGQECGLRIETKDKIEEKDIIEVYREETKRRKLEL